MGSSAAASAESGEGISDTPLRQSKLSREVESRRAGLRQKLEQLQGQLPSTAQCAQIQELDIKLREWQRENSSSPPSEADAGVSSRATRSSQSGGHGDARDSRATKRQRTR